MHYQRPRIHRAVLGHCSLANGRQLAPLKEAMDIGISRRRIPIACAQPARVRLGSRVPRAHDRNKHRLDADSQTRRNRAFDCELRSSFGSFGKDLELDALFQCIVACVHARTGISSKNQPGLMHRIFASAISLVAPTRFSPASHSRTCRTDIPRATASVFRLIPRAMRRARNRLPICLSTGLAMTI